MYVLRNIVCYTIRKKEEKESYHTNTKPEKERKKKIIWDVKKNATRKSLDSFFSFFCYIMCGRIKNSFYFLVDARCCCSAFFMDAFYVMFVCSFPFFFYFLRISFFRVLREKCHAFLTVVAILNRNRLIRRGMHEIISLRTSRRRCCWRRNCLSTHMWRKIVFRTTLLP